MTMATCNDCLHCEVCKKRHWHIIESQYMYQMKDVETRCEQFKNKADIIDIPDDTIMYIQDKWLVINTESEQLGKSIKGCLDYLTKDVRRDGNNEK